MRVKGSSTNPPSSIPPPPTHTHTRARTHRSIASHFPTGCISVLRTSAYPTSMKRIVSRLGDLKAYYCRTLAVPMPSYAMATLPVLALAAGCSAWEAVNYCDGDGGSILVEQFPGLSKYLRQQNVATHSLAAPQCTLVQVRQFIIACMTPPVPPPPVLWCSFERLSTMPWNLVTSTPWWQHGKTMSLGPARDSPPLPFRDGPMATRLSSMLVMHWRLQRCVATVQRWGLE